MGTIDEKEFYEICNYLNDRCIEMERNQETEFDFDFALKSGHNILVSGIYTNVGYTEKETGTFVDRVSKIFIYDLEYENDPLTGKLINRITKYVNKNLFTM